MSVADGKDPHHDIRSLTHVISSSLLSFVTQIASSVIEYEEKSDLGEGKLSFVFVNEWAAD